MTETYMSEDMETALWTEIQYMNKTEINDLRRRINRYLRTIAIHTK